LLERREKMKKEIVISFDDYNYIIRVIVRKPPIIFPGL